MLELRPFAPEDYARLIEWNPTLELLVQWAGPTFEHPLTVPQLEAYRQEGLGPAAANRNYTAVLDGTTRVGHISLGFIHPANGTGSICRVLVGPPYRGGGLGTAMVRAATRIGFDELRLRRLDLRVYTFNHPAIRAYERVGYVWEGCLRQWQKVGEQLWDVGLMAILREEWEAAK